MAKPEEKIIKESEYIWIIFLWEHGENKLKSFTDKITFSRTFFGKVSKSLLVNFDFESWNYYIPRRHGLLGQTTKQTFSNFEPKKPWKYKQLWWLRPDPIYLKKKISV